jgi:hypothetical protein
MTYRNNQQFKASHQNRGYIRSYLKPNNIKGGSLKMGSYIQGRGFFDDMLKGIKSVGSAILPALAPLAVSALQGGVNSLAQGNGRLAGVARGAQAVGNMALPFAGVASSALQQGLSNAGHSNSANLVGSTSQNILQSILQRQQGGRGLNGVGLNGLGKGKKGKGLNGLGGGTVNNNVIPTLLS